MDEVETALPADRTGSLAPAGHANGLDVYFTRVWSRQPRRGHG